MQKKLPSFVVYESSFTALVALALGFAAILQPSNRTMIRLTLMNSDELSAIRRNSDELQDFGDISPKKTPQVSHGQAFVILGLPDPGHHLLKQVEALSTWRRWPQNRWGAPRSMYVCMFQLSICVHVTAVCPQKTRLYVQILYTHVVFYRYIYICIHACSKLE